MDCRTRMSEIKWPEFIVVPSQERQHAKAEVIPVVVKDGGPCFAVTLNHRWLCGSQGELTYFDSMAAARRFLQLLNVHGLSFGAVEAMESHVGSKVQCYCLSRCGLASCARCSIGEQAEQRLVHEHAQQQECW